MWCEMHVRVSSHGQNVNMIKQWSREYSNYILVNEFCIHASLALDANKIFRNMNRGPEIAYEI